jgi:hypothetical protein
MISGREADKSNGNMGEWLRGDARAKHYKRVISKAVKEELEDNKRMEWYVFSVNANGTYTLRSEYGYERSNVSRSDFRLIKGGKTW